MRGFEPFLGSGTSSGLWDHDGAKFFFLILHFEKLFGIAMWVKN